MWLVVIAAVLYLVCVSPALAEDRPAKVRPFVATVDRCERFGDLMRRTGWKTEFELSIGRGPKVQEATIKVPQLPAQLVDSVVQYTTDSGKAGIVFDVSQYGAGLLKIGPEVSGEFAIEFRAKATSQRLNDLSIVCAEVGQAPSFQFGGFENTRNILFVGNDVEGEAGAVDGDASVTIRPNTWHTVRLEVRRNEMVGVVDGRVVAHAKPAKTYDFDKKRQPMIYLFASSAVISSYRVERPGDTVVSEDEAWSEAFLRMTRDEVMADLRELTKLLNDPDYETRQTAHEQLARAGKLATAPLRAATRTGGLEGRERARSLLRLIGVDTTEE